MKTFTILLLFLSQQLFALITVAPVEIGDKPGTSASIEAALSTTRGNTDTDSYKGSARITYDSDTSYVTWAEISGSYGKSGGEKNTDKLFSHVRYIHALTPETLRWELFAQLQTDEFKQINSRALSGGGIRLRLFDLLEGGKGYFGIGAFYENIRYKEPDIDPSEDNARLNSYFAYSIDLSDTSSIAYTIYYQPKIDKFSDNVQSHDLELKLGIYKKLFLKFSLSYDTDTEPPAGVKKYDFSQTTSLVLDF